MEMTQRDAEEGNAQQRSSTLTLKGEAIRDQVCSDDSWSTHRFYDQQRRGCHCSERHFAAAKVLHIDRLRDSADASSLPSRRQLAQEIRRPDHSPERSM